MKRTGKVGKRRAKGMKAAAPVVCERAGGRWNGRYCEGAQCELCGRQASDMAHVISRAQGGDESLDNLAALCRECHNMLDGGDSETRERLREELRERIIRTREGL